jgi:hypothetical protein
MMIVDMGDPDVGGQIVKDIDAAGPGVPWRWTHQQPTVKILAVSTEHMRLVADFALWDVALKQTGPVELSFLVNNRLVDRVRYTAPGTYHFEKSIPPDWLTTDVESTVAISIDKLYTAPQDGMKFGFILSRIGFAQ